MLTHAITEGQRLYLTKVLGIESWIRPVPIPPSPITSKVSLSKVSLDLGKARLGEAHLEEKKDLVDVIDNVPKELFQTKGLILLTEGPWGLQESNLIQRIIAAAKISNIHHHHIEKLLDEASSSEESLTWLPQCSTKALESWPEEGPTFFLFFGERAAQYTTGKPLQEGDSGHYNGVTYSVTYNLRELLGKSKEVFYKKKKTWGIIQRLRGEQSRLIN